MDNEPNFRKVLFPAAVMVLSTSASTFYALQGSWWVAAVWIVPIVTSFFTLSSVVRFSYWNGRMDEARKINQIFSGPWWPNG